MSWASTAAARRRLRQGARLVVHRRGASPAPVATPKTAAAWRPAAGLYRAHRCAGRTSTAISGCRAMKRSARGRLLNSQRDAAHQCAFGRGCLRWAVRYEPRSCRASRSVSRVCYQSPKKLQLADLRRAVTHDCNRPTWWKTGQFCPRRVRALSKEQLLELPGL